MTHDEAVDRICEMHEHVVRLTAERDELREAVASVLPPILEAAQHPMTPFAVQCELADVHVRLSIAKGETDAE